ncbi:MAG: hypothetical protein IPN72_13430 [Saprospiraceae bacterium]|nr:hypothetical protein [Saprospiraceae bacterium]
MIAVCIFIQPACKHDHATNKDLERAKAYYKSALEASENLERMLDTMVVNDSIRSIFVDRIKQWEESVVEMEGMAHAHKHSEHNHDHKGGYQITDKQMVDVQKAWLDTILTIEMDMKNSGKASNQ